LPLPHYQFPPKKVILWRCNYKETRIGEFEYLKDAIRKGARLILIDLHKIKGIKPDIWLSIKPGTDLFLAISMIRLIIERELYDKEFVEKWTVGFKELKEYVKDHSLDLAEKITWISKDLIKEAAIRYAP